MLRAINRIQFPKGGGGKKVSNDFHHDFSVSFYVGQSRICFKLRKKNDIKSNLIDSRWDLDERKKKRENEGEERKREREKRENNNEKHIRNNLCLI